ncbi:hypothetical protein CLIM01_13395 [Colletotrichum limetticola]|uniref:Uncharacterized protein n=1 Tax=Colletotrichum limetticola TaxID=1209924 RepID=A0ABQ9PAX1_9PEZI|nr:hypothetical protein CLIM01_13395 [Colletotrichum limetticola]
MKTKRANAARGPSEILSDAPEITRQERIVITRLLGGRQSFHVNPLTDKEMAVLKRFVPRLIKASKDPRMPDADSFFDRNFETYLFIFDDALRVVMQLKKWYGPVVSH